MRIFHDLYHKKLIFLNQKRHDDKQFLGKEKVQHYILK